MKSVFKKLSVGIAIISAFTVLGSACHSHDFACKVEDEAYLKSEATCQSGKTYYFSCECGEAGEETFSVGKKIPHEFSAEVKDAQYVKKEANCQSGAVYYKSCSMCGLRSSATFTVDELGDHSYTEEVPEGRFMKEEATKTSSAVYYKSCVCGLAGTETFSFGEALREYTTEEKAYYEATSLTVTLYDTENSVYGFTYNTQKRPLRPVIQIAEGEKFENYAEYPAMVEEATSYETNNEQFIYYIVKAEVTLDPSTTYTYRAYDKYVEIGTELTYFDTKDLTADTFSFAHVADTQNHPTEFGKVLGQVVGINDFLLHTGDVVETSKYESEWKAMLDGNYSYLSQIPMMAISGNHETTYKNGSNEVYKHFHNKMPEQETELGYYYSFYYGNAKFIMLNTNRLSGYNNLTEEQYAWLVEELENNTATWTFVAMHNPMYSAGSYGSDSSRNGICLALRRQLQGIFADYGVDVVLQGHDHLISRTNPIDGDGDVMTEEWTTVDGIQYSVDPKGVLYVMSGTAGSQTRSPHADMNPALYNYAESSTPSSWTEFSISGNKLTATVKRVNGTTAQAMRQWGIVKGAQA